MELLDGKKIASDIKIEITAEVNKMKSLLGQALSGYAIQTLIIKCIKQKKVIKILILVLLSRY